jgi:hypothetical protein
MAGMTGVEPVLIQLCTNCFVGSANTCPLKKVAYPTGFEPVTIRLEGGCSIQLSYGYVKIGGQGMDFNHTLTAFVTG